MDIREKVGVAPIGEKLTQRRLRWFGHIQRRPSDAPIRRGVPCTEEGVRRGRGRPRLTWQEVVKRDMRDWDICQELVLDRKAWREAIKVTEP